MARGPSRVWQVHAQDKQLPRGGDEEFDDDALLRRTAQLTVGYSGAELANLLNEAAIIAVRREKPEIGMPELEVRANSIDYAFGKNKKKY